MQALRQSAKAHEGSGPTGSTLSTGLHVYLNQCWDPYVSPGCIVRQCFLLGVSSLFQHVDLLTTSSRAGFQVTSLNPEFCIGRSNQYNRISWQLDLIFVFFVFLLVDCLGGWNQKMQLLSCRSLANLGARTRSQV